MRFSSEVSIKVLNMVRLLNTGNWVSSVLKACPVLGMVSER